MLIMICSGYTQQKVQENVEAEIMQVVSDEAHESYPEGIVMVGPFSH